MSHRLYVYYRLPAADAAAVTAAVHAMQAAWRPALRGELLRRASDGDTQVTLMETYEADGGVSAALQAQIEAEARRVLTAWPQIVRHTEVFVPCA